MSLNYFNDSNYLEPKCGHCSSKIDYDVTTTYDDDEEAHLCNSCGHAV